MRLWKKIFLQQNRIKDKIFTKNEKEKGFPKTRKGAVLICPLRACCPHCLNTHECSAQ